MEIEYSIKGNDLLGQWLPYPDRIIIFVNTISEEHECDPEEFFESFIAEIIAVEFHELGHIYGFRDGCSDIEDEICEKCYWCKITNKIKKYILKNLRKNSL